MKISFPELRLIAVNILIIWSETDEIDLKEVIEYLEAKAELLAKQREDKSNFCLGPEFIKPMAEIKPGDSVNVPYRDEPLAICHLIGGANGLPWDRELTDEQIKAHVAKRAREAVKPTNVTEGDLTTF